MTLSVVVSVQQTLKYIILSTTNSYRQISRRIPNVFRFQQRKSHILCGEQTLHYKKPINAKWCGQILRRIQNLTVHNIIYLQTDFTANSKLLSFKTVQNSQNMRQVETLHYKIPITARLCRQILQRIHYQYAANRNPYRHSNPYIA